MLAALPTPTWFPEFSYKLADYFTLKSNWASVVTALYLSYYLILFPAGAVRVGNHISVRSVDPCNSPQMMYAPQQIAFLLTATDISGDPKNIRLALALHAASWIAQFYGHGVHEGRAPALLDNIVGGMFLWLYIHITLSLSSSLALFLAPFFVHLEMLFELGYFPGLHKRVQNGVGVEIAKFRREKAAEGKKKTS